MTDQLPPRTWQTEAHAKVRQSWRDNPSYRALIAACPGSGKTRCAVTIANELLREGGIELGLVLTPTVNIQGQWADEFKKFDVKATCDASNEALRWRRDRNQTMREDKAAIVITYHQLARDPELFAALTARHKTLLIPDEVHHADEDEAFGSAINRVCENVTHSLALSGTPFNSVGGSLALCESHEIIDPDTGKPVRQTVPTYSYSYGTAIDDNVCRTVEFVKVEGQGRATYRSLTDQTLFERLIKTSRKSDRIGLLLDPNGEYIGQCVREALQALTKMREAGDRRAAMLVVAKTVAHGNALIETIERIKQENPAWRQFANIQGIDNDTEKAHDRIKALENDNADIVVSVRMISEGVDIKRLRVGLYATDWMTRMFFIQFIGRFVRYENRPPLDDLQYAVVVIPAHPDLLKWTLEIEQMILASQIRLDGEGPGHRDKINQLLGVETSADGSGLIYRGEEIERQTIIIKTLREKSSVFRNMPDSLVLKVANDLGIGGGKSGTTAEPPSIDWRTRNNTVAKNLVRIMRANGESDGELFARINGKANTHVGIPRMDAMTPDEVLQKRLVYLQEQLRHTLRDQNPDLFDPGKFNA